MRGEGRSSASTWELFTTGLSRIHGIWSVICTLCIYYKHSVIYNQHSVILRGMYGVINFASSLEQQDVHNFLLSNMTNGGILDLMLRYLKAVGQKFMKAWPRGLTAVVLEVYQTWRKHSGGLPNPLLRDCSNQHIRVNAGKEL